MKKYILLLIIINIIICDDDPMNYIIDNIYLGGRDAARDIEYLKQYNITTVINCAEEIESIYEDIKFLEIKLYDDEDRQKLFPKFDVAYKFIKKNPDNNILIHCAMGVSRSASLVVFYIMKEKGWDYDYTISYIRERRPSVEPNPYFVAKIKEYFEKNNKK